MNDTSTLKPGHIQGETGIWEMVIGLEIHAQISSKSKLFSGASASFGSEANSCLLYTSPSPRDATLSRMPSSA